MKTFIYLLVLLNLLAIDGAAVDDKKNPLDRKKMVQSVRTTCKDDCEKSWCKCSKWASNGDCDSGEWVDWMKKHCKKSCGLCGGTGCAKIPSWMTNSKIVGGQYAAEMIPWQVFVQVIGPCESISGCGGTILDEWTILTAAHCFFPKGKVNGDATNELFEEDAITNYDLIFAGMVKKSQYSHKGQIIGVESIIVHEDYNPRYYDNDIAILKLNSSLSFNENVRPACLPSKNILLNGGQQAFTSGWGALKWEGDTPDNLKYVKIPLVTNSNCAKHVEDLTSNMLCAGGLPQGGQDACQGDSGGPLVVAGSDNSAIIVGVVSYGEGCARPNQPGVYVRVTEYLDWIEDRMN